MKKLLVFLMMAVMACSMMLAGCGGDKKEAKKAEPAKVLRVGTEPAFAPFEFPKEGSKELTGFDIELIAFNANAKFGLKLLFDFLRLVRLCAVGNDNVIAFACKFLCNSGAKTSGCAGHN